MHGPTLDRWACADARLLFGAKFRPVVGPTLDARGTLEEGFSQRCVEVELSDADGPTLDARTTPEGGRLLDLLGVGPRAVDAPTLAARTTPFMGRSLGGASDHSAVDGPTLDARTTPDTGRLLDVPAPHRVGIRDGVRGGGEGASSSNSVSMLMTPNVSSNPSAVAGRLPSTGLDGLISSVSARLIGRAASPLTRGIRLGVATVPERR